jgi:hypothetical protein
MFSPNRTLGSASQSSSMHLGSLLLLAFIVASPLSASKQTFTVPDDLALRIRLDDTLTSDDSQVGDPFSATVVDQGAYRNARVYGRITRIDLSGKIEGHTTTMSEFNRLVMPDGRRAPIRAEIVELYHAPSGEKVDVEGAIELGGRGRKTIEHTAIGAGAGALLGGIFGGGKGAGIGSVIGGVGGPRNYGLHRTPEDYAEQRAGDDDSHHGALRGEKSGANDGRGSFLLWPPIGGTRTSARLSIRQGARPNR